MTDMNKKKSNNNLYNVLFVVIIIIIILVYFSSLGKVNLISHQNRSSWIEDKISNLKKSGNSKMQLKLELDAKVKKYFQYSRIFLVGIYFIVCFVIYNCLDTSFFDRLFFILNITQVVAILILAALFIRFDKPSDFKDISRLIHLYIKDAVYRNHKNLDDEVKNINIEIDLLEQEKNNIKLTETTKNND